MFTEQWQAPLDALRAEQLAVQETKFQGRMLLEYNQTLFPGQVYREQRGCPVSDFVRPYTLDGDVSLEGIIEGMYAAKGDAPVNWTDMGGGRALAMRQLNASPEFCQRVATTNVDLFNYGLYQLDDKSLIYIEKVQRGMTAEANAPRYISANIENVVLPDSPDMITSIETMQYLNDPLNAIASWYNQLADYGLLLIGTEHRFSEWIRYERSTISTTESEKPFVDIMRTLTYAGIAHAFTDDIDYMYGGRPDSDASRMRVLAIQKLPHSSITLHKPVVDVWRNITDYKAVYYQRPNDANKPLITVHHTV